MAAAGSPRPAALTVTARDAGTRLDQFIRTHLTDLSRSQIQSLIRDGFVTLSEGHAKPALAVWEGLRVDVRLPEVRPAAPAAEALPITLLYDDDDIAVVNKPAGMVVHPAAGAPHTRVTYSLPMPRSWNCRDRARCARSFFATTITPDVPRSRRWTMPGRSVPPMPLRPPRWWRSAFTNVPLV